jgi:hypothetical protein
MKATLIEVGIVRSQRLLRGCLDVSQGAEPICGGEVGAGVASRANVFVPAIVAITAGALRVKLADHHSAPIVFSLLSTDMWMTVTLQSGFAGRGQLSKGRHLF